LLFLSGCGRETPITVYKNTDYSQFPRDIISPFNSQFRQIIDLNGAWQFKTSPEENWQEIFIPSSIDYEGILYFKKEFTPPASIADRHLKLLFYGVNYKCSIRINNAIFPDHVGGYSTFYLDLPDNLIIPNQTNVIEITVDNKLNLRDTVPLKQDIWGWKNYAGIIREIYLISIPEISLEDVSTDLEFSSDYKSCNAEINFNIRDFGVSEFKETESAKALDKTKQTNINYRIEIRDKEENRIIGSRESSTQLTSRQGKEISEAIQINDIRIWSPSNPKLYELKIRLFLGNNQIDEINSTLGFREFKALRGDFFLNGNKIFIRGIIRYDQHPDYGNSLSWNTMEKDILKIKNLGINAIRVAHFPSHPYFVDLCDKYGLLLFEEIPLRKIPAPYFNKTEYLEISSAYLKETINRDKLHPSVVGWGLGSEFESSSVSTGEFLNRLNVFSKEIDKRMTFFSSSIPEKDICLNYVDFNAVIFNNGSLEKFRTDVDKFGTTNADKPIIIDKIGTDVFPGLEKSNGEVVSLTYQVKYLLDRIMFLENHKSIDGYFIWSFTDWIGSIPLLTSEPLKTPYTYYRGLTDLQRKERPAYQYLKSFISGIELPSLITNTGGSENPPFFILSGFFYIIFILLLSKRTKWFGQNLRRSLFYTKGLNTDLKDKRLPLLHTVLIGVVGGGIIGEIVSIMAYYFKRNITFDFFITHFAVSNSLKELLSFLVWHPLLFTLFNLAVIFIAILIFSLIVTVFYSISGLRISYSSTVQIFMWSGSIFLLLIPVIMILFQMLSFKVAQYFIIVLLLIFILWYITRCISGFKFVLKTTWVKTSLMFSGSVIFIVLIILLFYQKKQHTFEFLNFLLTNIK